MSDREMRILFSYIKQFYTKSRRHLDRIYARGYEPTGDKSHIWANMQTLIQEAEDIIQDYEEELFE